MLFDVTRSKRACHGCEETSSTFAKRTRAMNTKRIRVRASFELFCRCSRNIEKIEAQPGVTIRCESVGIQSVSSENVISTNDREKERKRERKKGRGEKRANARWTQCCETCVILSSVTSIIFSYFVV